MEGIHKQYVPLSNHCKHLVVRDVLGVESILFHVDVLKKVNGVNKDKSTSRNCNPTYWGYLAATLLFRQINCHLDDRWIERMLVHHL